MEYEVVGKRIANIDAPAKSRGQSLYLDDIKLPNMLHAKMLRSPLPHARILNIDASRAKAHPGVKAVITGHDIPPIKWGTGYQGADQNTLAMDKVRHVGDGVAAVAAVDEETAEEALGLIRVEYQPLPAVLDPFEAIKPGSPRVHDDVENNIANKVIKTYGDIERGFRESDYIREDTFTTPINNHAPMEPHASIGLWHDDGTLTLWATCQAPFIVRRGLVRPLGIAEDKVHVIRSEVGGGFGGKMETFSYQIISAYLSKLTGKPVKIICSREEVFISTRQRQPSTVKLRTGLKKDGSFVSQDSQFIVDCGAYRGLGPIITIIGAYMLMLPYIIPNFRFEGTRVYTNRAPGGPMRGHGAPQVRFAMESHLDMIARDLNIDPVDIRLKNAVYAGFDHPGKQQIFSCGFKEDVEAAAKALGWRTRKGKLPDGHGIGIGASGLFSGVKYQPHYGGSATIQIGNDGGVNVLCGATDIGQGTNTIICQIAAEEVGCRFEDVHLITGDTRAAPYDYGSFGSGVTFRVGNAAINAGREVKKQLLQAVAPHLEVSPDELEARGGKVFVKGHMEKGISFKEAIRIYSHAGNPMPLVGRGYYEPETEPGTELVKKEGQFSSTYAFIAQGVEVKVDRETGEFKILNIVTADECGQPINPINVEGQVDGSVAGGTGMACFEEIPEKEGQYLSTTFLDYLLPTCLDMPEKACSLEMSTRDPRGPYGAKEAGEGVQVPTAPAIANAIYDAVGVRICDLPITPDKIKKAMEKSG